MKQTLLRLLVLLMATSMLLASFILAHAASGETQPTTSEQNQTTASNKDDAQGSDQGGNEGNGGSENGGGDEEPTPSPEETIFLAGMAYLAEGKFSFAYEEFLKIPDYTSEDGIRVADVLAHFSEKYTGVFIFNSEEIDYTFRHTYNYDDYGNLTNFAVIDSNAHEVTYTSSYNNKKVYSRVSYTYNELGQRVQRQIYPTLWLYEYDENGLLSKYMECQQANTDKINFTTTYTYDNGRLINETKKDKTDTILHTIDYAYEGDLLVKTTTSVFGDTPMVTDTVYIYENGLLVSVKGVEVIDYPYEMIAPYEITYTYDKYGRMIREMIEYKDLDGIYNPREELLTLDENKKGVSGLILSKDRTYTYDQYDRQATMTEILTYRTTETVDGNTITKDDNTITYEYLFTKYKVFFNPFQ